MVEIYAATYPNGISRFSRSGKLLDNYRSASVITAGWIQTIAFDHQGRLWAGGADGCFRSKRPLGVGNLELDRVEIPGMAKGTQFFEFMADGDTLWAASSHGLARLVNDQWRIFTQKDGLKSDAVFVLARGGDALWISYEDSMGLSKLEFNGSKIERTDFTRKNGLASDEVFGIVFDTAGRLWHPPMPASISWIMVTGGLLWPRGRIGSGLIRTAWRWRSTMKATYGSEPRLDSLAIPRPD